nr:zf-CCHC domain-containing protein/UBN2 domain-containing protein [Tanacetum cinerariifolium]
AHSQINCRAGTRCVTILAKHEKTSRNAGKLPGTHRNDNINTPIRKGDHDSENEVESVDNDMARSMASKRDGFGTKSLLEQLRDSYENGDYDEDPYDDYMALHLKWRAIGMAIKESKDLSSLALDELIGNLKVHEVVMEKDSEIYRGKKERVKSIALKAKKESSDNETLTSRSNDK